VTDQASLFEGASPDPDRNRLGPFQRDSETSREAALDNYPRSGTQRRRVLDAIVTADDGYTREELSVDLHLPLNSVHPRVVELVNAGLVVASSKTRTTSTGSRAAVLMAVQSPKGSP
jgi:hypothetical protein